MHDSPREAASLGFYAIERGDYLNFETFDDLERHPIDIADAGLRTKGPPA